MSKIKVKDIEGSSEDVLAFCNAGGIDISSYINSPEKIKASLKSVVISLIAFVVFCCVFPFIGEGYPKIRAVLSIITLSTAFVSVGLIYMFCKNKTLSTFVVVAELIVFGLAQNIYTTEYVVKKAEQHIEKMEGK